MARHAASRKELSAAGLLGIARRCFEAVADPVARRGGASLVDCLMSGLAVYGLKYASLLKFDEAARGDDAVRSNLRRLYGVSRVPSDTRMREASACRSAGTRWTRGRCGPATGGCSRRRGIYISGMEPVADTNYNMGGMSVSSTWGSALVVVWGALLTALARPLGRFVSRDR